MDTWQRGTISTLAPRWDASAAQNDSADQMGTVRISRRVLRTVVREATLQVPGVVRLAEPPRAWSSVLGRRPEGGVLLRIQQDLVGVDLYLVVEAGLNLVTIGEAVQEAIGAAIEHILGIRVGEINVYIRDVA